MWTLLWFVYPSCEYFMFIDVSLLLSVTNRKRNLYFLCIFFRVTHTSSRNFTVEKNVESFHVISVITLYACLVLSCLLLSWSPFSYTFQCWRRQIKVLIGVDDLHVFSHQCKISSCRKCFFVIIIVSIVITWSLTASAIKSFWLLVPSRFLCLL